MKAQTPIYALAAIAVCLPLCYLESAVLLRQLERVRQGGGETAGWPAALLVLVVVSACVLAMGTERLLSHGPWKALRTPTPLRAVVIGAFTVLLLELAVAAAFEHVRPPLVERDDRLYRMNPGLHFPTFDVRRCALGTRGSDPLPKDGRNPLMVLVLGDSTMFGFGVDQPLIFSEQLQRMLRECFPDRRVDVVTAAEPGLRTAHARAALEGRWASCQPEIVLVGVNNDSLRPSTMVPPSPGRVSALYRLVAEVSVSDPYLFPRFSQWTAPTDDTAALTDFRENLHAMNKTASAWGGRVIFVSLPRHLTEPLLPHMLSLKSEFRAAARAIMQEDGQHFFDLAAVFPEADERYFISMLPDEVHPNAAGHTIMAQRIFEFITRQPSLLAPVPSRLP